MTHLHLWHRDGTVDGDYCAWMIQFVNDGQTYTIVLGDTLTEDEARATFASYVARADGENGEVTTMTTDQPPAAHEGTTERDRVEAWRARMLVIAGYPGETAWDLAADTNVDVHFAADLLARNCPLLTALQILAPLP